MLLLLFFPTQAAPASAGYVNLALAVGDLWAPLNATGEADAVFWTEAELYEWMDEAGKRLARRMGVFVARNTSLSSVEDQGDYSLPAAHVSTLQADLAGFVLRARNVQELEALDAGWPTAASDAPKAFLEDTQGLTRLTIYPPPDSDHDALAIGLVMQQLPPDISKAAAILAAPPVMREYFTFYALGEARSKESNASMDEIGQWFRGVVGQYEQAIAALWK